MISALLAFAVPAVLAHFGAGAAITGIFGAVGGRLATRAITGGAAAGIKALLQHIHQGKPVTDEQRAWLNDNAEALYLVPKLQPGADQIPPIWDTPKAP